MRESVLKRYLPPTLSGILFGAGLALGGMTDPARVRGFLDWFGNWDPTLAFVMGGAVAVMAIAWQIQPRMAHPLFGKVFALPDKTDLTPQLVGGAALFGVGWGIAGLCPGPGFAIFALAPLEALVFSFSLFIGIAAHRFAFDRPREVHTRAAQ